MKMASKVFYILFKKKLSEELAILLNNIIWTGEMPLSQKNAIVTLIYKKGDHRNLKNWRPVSLFNTDYKKQSKILTNRMKSILEINTNKPETWSERQKH